MIQIKIFKYQGSNQIADALEVNGIDELRDYMLKYLNEFNEDIFTNTKIYYYWEDNGICEHQVLISAEPETDMEKMANLIADRVKTFGYSCVFRKYTSEEMDKVSGSDDYYGDEDDFMYQPIIVIDPDSETYQQLKADHWAY